MPSVRSLSLCVSLTLLLLSVALMGSCQPAGTPATGPAVSEAEQAANDLAQDVSLLHTLNRLDLQPAQLDPLLAVAQQAVDARAKAEPARQAALARLVPLLREKRGLLLKDQDIPEELDKQLHAAQATAEEADEQVASATLAVVPELRKVLTEDQVAIITGADEARAQAEDLLGWIRQLSAGTYAEEGKANAEQLADPTVNLTAADILKVFDETRKLSATDYAAKKSQYIARLAPLYSPTVDAANQALADLLASSRLPSLLRERGAK